MMMKMVGVAVSHQILSPQSLLSTAPPRFPLPSPSTVVPALIGVSPLLQAVRSSSPSPSSRVRIQCNSSSSPGGPGPGENDSKAILDAFFLGKAVADALTERIESTVGEFLSTIGRLQAEQQKQVQEFQEEVFERAKKAKETAAREAKGGPGLAPTSFSENPSTMTRSSTSDASSSESYTVTTATPDPSSVANVNGPVTSEGDEATSKDPLSGVSSDE